MVEYSQITTTTYALTAEGEGIAKDGSHEYRVWTALSPTGGEPKSVQDLQVSLGLRRWRRRPRTEGTGVSVLMSEIGRGRDDQGRAVAGDEEQVDDEGGCGIRPGRELRLGGSEYGPADGSAKMWQTRRRRTSEPCRPRGSSGTRRWSRSCLSESSFSRGELDAQHWRG